MANTTIVLPRYLTQDASGNITITGQALAANGSAAAPSYAFTNDPDSGMYRAGSNSLGLSAGGTAFLTATTTVVTLPLTTVTMSAAAPTINASAATTYLQTYQNNGTDVARLDKGGFVVPAGGTPSTRYFSYDWDMVALAATFTQNGSATSVVVGATNSVSAPLMAASSMGVAYVQTESTTQGGYVCLPSAYPLIASSTINYQWRILFYHPAASTAGNTYTSYIGGHVMTGTANNTCLPFAGPYISYSHGANSGNWVLGSAVNNTRTTGNSAVAATNYLGAWNILTISLANGTYTYTIANASGANSQSLGTLADANITASVGSGRAAGAGGIAVIPDGANFTTARVLMIDRSDFWVTGLTY